jgi:hypothetical protein
MKALLLLLALAIPQKQEWKFIKELSGEIKDHPGLTVEIRMSEIARGGDRIRLLMRADFPGGAPRDVFQPLVPRGFDASSISRLEGKLELDCKALMVKPVRGSAEIYQFNGKKHKTKEPPFKINDAHIFARYFCELGEAPKKAPVLKP